MERVNERVFIAPEGFRLDDDNPETGTSFDASRRGPFLNDVCVFIRYASRRLMEHLGSHR